MYMYLKVSEFLIWRKIKNALKLSMWRIIQDALFSENKSKK